ncbi:ribonucleoside triphosphate reductase, partial [bacterium]|nr:ribonucleoside triphosphate reductase [bacterium]
MGLQLFAIEKVKKYDGNVVDFVPEKISTSIFDVVNDTNIDKKIDKESADILTHKVGGILEYQCNSSKIPTTDDIKHSIAIVLKNAGYAGAAEVFWPCHKKKLGARGTLIDAKELIDSYAGGKDWRIKENSNESYSFSGLLLFTAGRVVNRYALNEIYSPEIKEAHVNGYFHIHDLNNAIICYCCGWSLKNLLLLGLGGVPNKIDCKPAKHLSTVVHHMINFIGCVQMENAGAQAFSSVDTYLAPFVKNGNLSYKETKQAIQQLVFSFNIPSRWGSQTPFTNLTFDWTVPDDLANEKAIVGGKPQEFTYGDCTREMGMINKAFLEVLLEGDAKGRVFTWPIPTYNLTKDFDWDSENANLLFDVTSKFGLPYFQNYIGSDLDPKSIRAMCCRMNLNLNELLKRPGGMWGPGDSTGSIGVVTINLNRLGYEAKDKESYFEKLGHYMLLAKQSLETKRKIIDQNLSRGLMPYTKRYLGSFGNHFSTIGLCGMNEACLNFLGKDISTEEGVQFTIETLNFMR